MSKYLVNTCEVYRVDSEKEAMALIQQAKEDHTFVLSKYTNEHKERKSKGEIVDEYYKITLTKVFTDIKEPDSQVTINYEVE